MSNHQDLRLIHLAKLPPIVYRTGRVNPAIVRAVLLAIAIDTDNGRNPLPRHEIAEACGMNPGSSNYVDAIISLLIVAGLVNLDRNRAASIGAPRTKGVSVNFAGLQKIARLPRCHNAPVVDPDGVAAKPLPRELLELRTEALDRLGVGIAYVGKFGQAERNTEARAAVRAEAIRFVRDGWRKRTGRALSLPDLGRVFGLGPKSVAFTLMRYPANPDAKAATIARTMSPIGAPR